MTYEIKMGLFYDKEVMYLFESGHDIMFFVRLPKCKW